MNIEKVAVFANSKNERIKETLKTVKDYFDCRKMKCYVVELSNTAGDYLKTFPECNLAISLGGDGTVLTTAVILRDSGIPVMAVNMGTFGYISEIAVSEFKQAFENYENGIVSVSSRILLNVSVKRDGKTVFSSVALNDATIAVSSRAKLGKLTVYINDTLAANLKADGIIIATPTGSTAYSLSAGGPVLESNLKGLIVNPICPFSMSVRPLVVSDTSEIQIDIPQQNASLILTSDGHEVFELEKGDRIEISKYSKEIPFVQNIKRNFIETLRNKLGWAGEFNA